MELIYLFLKKLITDNGHLSIYKNRSTTKFHHRLN